MTAEEAELYPVAWELHNLGLSVIPSGGGETGKQPLIPWTEFQHRRPTDSELHSWQDELRPSLWGVCTGGDIAVFDCDRPETMRLFEDAGLRPHVRTPRGQHFYFRTEYPVKTVAGLLLGLDVRGEKGFANACGRNHGGEYLIEIMPSPEKLYHWSQLPSEVLIALNAAKAPPIKGEAATVAVIPEGQRNATLTSMAGAMRRKGMASEAISVALLETNLRQCQPPLPEAEIRTIVASVGRYAPASGGDAKTGNNVTIYGYREQTLQAQSTNKRYKNVTESRCNGGSPDAVTVEADETAFERVLEWVKGTSGWWTTQELDSDMGFKTPQEKNYRRLIIHRLKEQGVIEPHPTVNKSFRYVDKRLTRLDFKRASAAGVLSLKWPFAIERHVNLYPGNLVVVAGSQNAGKSAFLLNLIKMNMDQFPIVYFSSEMGDVELGKRLEMFPGMSLDDWHFDPYPRTRDFQDVVRPDLINVVDFLEVSDEFWKVNAMLTAITEKIGSGLLVVALQKDANKPLGRGASFSLERPRLYLSMDYDNRTQIGKLTIVKGKSWANLTVNPNGLSVQFEISRGCEFRVTKEWAASRD